MTDDPTRRHTRRLSRLATIASASIAGLLLLVAGSFAANAATTQVAVANFAFQPATRSINVGDVVSWTFSGDPHTVTSGSPGAPNGAFDSGIKAPGGTFQLTFGTPGTFPYFCQIHPEQMTGSIIVTAVSTPKPTSTSTATPSLEPTIRPTASPTASPRATATASAKPTSTTSASATATEASTASPTTTASAAGIEPAATEPSASEPASTAASSQSAGPSAAPAPSRATTPGPDETADAGTFDPAPVLLMAIVVGLLVAGGVALVRRPRAG